MIGYGCNHLRGFIIDICACCALNIQSKLCKRLLGKLNRLKLLSYQLVVPNDPHKQSLLPAKLCRIFQKLLNPCPAALLLGKTVQTSGIFVI